MSKPILCLHFDGVIHSYTSGWQGADLIPDPPVPGALEFIVRALDSFRVAVYSSRSNGAAGRMAMRVWLRAAFINAGFDRVNSIMDQIEFPAERPPAFVTLDDRAITFTGEWPTFSELLDFKPWNKK